MKKSSTMKAVRRFRFAQPVMLTITFLVALALVLQAAIAAVASAATAEPTATTPPPATNSRTYTSDADFAAGTLFNVNNDAPNSNQLQLNEILTTFPVMWIANTNEDTVSKIDTVTGKETARYRTHVGVCCGYPSRTAVDKDGNVYVANRTFSNTRPAEVIKILASGGVDRNGNGVIETSADLNNNGRTPLTDPNEVLPLVDSNGDGIMQTNEFRDERIAWSSPINSLTASEKAAFNQNMARSLTFDAQGNLWVGFHEPGKYYKLDPSDGHIIAGPILVGRVAGFLSNTPYGSIVDKNGILWGASLSNTLLRLDTNMTAPSFANGGVKVFDHGVHGGDYGITLSSKTAADGSVNPLVVQSNYSNRNYTLFDPITNTFSTPAFPARSYYSYGIASDSKGDIFIGRSNNGVAKFNHVTHTVMWEAGVQPGAGGQHGVIVDSQDNVWLINLGSNTVSKYRGSDGAALGVFPVGQGPYTYSDATGLSAFANTSASGKWTVIQDGGAAGTKWGTVSWNTEPQGDVPVGASISVEARSANTVVGLGSATFTNVANGTRFNMTGQFIEVRVTMTANGDGDSPVLSDITIAEGQAATTTSLSSNTATTYGDDITLTATVASDGGSPDGTVDFFHGSTLLGSAPVSGGIATLTMPSQPAGSYEFSANYSGSPDFLVSDGATTHVVNKAQATITLNNLSHTYDGTAKSATATTNPAGLAGLSVVHSPDPPVNAGDYAVSATLVNDNYEAPETTDTLTIAKASPTVTVNGGNFTFDGNPHPATGQVLGVNNEDLGALSLTYEPGGSAPVDAGVYNVEGTFAGNANYLGASDTATITIGKATATVNVTGGTFTYDADAHPATGSVTGVGGANLGAPSFTYNGSSDAPVNAGTYGVVASFPGNGNYEAASNDTAVIVINKALATVDVVGGTFTFDGESHPASGTATGVGGADLGPLTFTYNGGSEEPVSAGSYAVVGSFSGNENYEPGSDSATVLINKATATIDVSGGTFTFDGQPHAATGTVTGVGGADLGPLTFTYDGGSDAPVNAGSYEAVGSFTGNDNYEAGSDTATILINKATPTVNVTGGTFTFDGQPHAASGSTSGVDGNEVSGTLAFTYSPGGNSAPNEAGSYDFNASFTSGDPNYNDATGNGSITINKAAPVVEVTGGDFTFDGQPHPAVGTVTGVGGANLGAPSFTYNGAAAAPLNAGNYDVIGSFSGNANYEPASDAATVNIAKATPVLSNLSSPTITQGATTTALSGTLNLGSLVPSGSVSITLNGVTQSAALQPGGTFSSSFATGSLTPTTPPYNISFSFGGDSNFNSVNGTSTLSVVYRVCLLYDPNKAHKRGSTIPIRIMLCDVSGQNLSSAGTVLHTVGLSLITQSTYGPVEDSGNANPDSNFRFTEGAYQFNLKTTGLSSGTYNLYFTAGNDASVHTTRFQIK